MAKLFFGHSQMMQLLKTFLNLDFELIPLYAVEYRLNKKLMLFIWQKNKMHIFVSRLGMEQMMCP